MDCQNCDSDAGLQQRLQKTVENRVLHLAIKLYLILFKALCLIHLSVKGRRWLCLIPS